ncbi:SusD domain-containing protein [Proteiniphilum saccharofermentans]|uniref:SusD domain-containing protein n=1 Tax=Proteiniphilum saccharofermentans TaxID=1642647 RepID=A0A1R3T427_9BACT|nr:RagB/SusD family nutrient uptake outer membrane protein [Proteiniphilum saccharofermentans]SCD20882.1 SusD domain-containing protein [Proteiniphilum saccharofermentans]
MKKYIIFISCLIFSTVFFSCEDFLEKPISSDITVDSVFNSTIRTEQFLWNVYSTASIYEFNHFWSSTDPRFYHYGASGSLVSVATDELEVEGTYPAIPRYFHTGTWNAATIDPGSWGLEFMSHITYQGIRNANIFIENVDKSPFPESEKNSMKAEARFLRALMHFDLMQRLGGISIVDRVLSVSSINDVEGVKIPRSTYAQTVDFIVSECEEAAKFLPNVYEDTKYLGRIVKGAALALKARVLLYAASPLFNDPEGKTYVPVSDPVLRELIGYPSYDQNRWQLAVQANKAVLDWASGESGWCRLYDGFDNPVDRYEEIFINHTCPEVILSAGLMQNAGGYFCLFMLPGQIIPQGQNNPSNHAITFNFTKFYQKKDGTDQVWDEVEGVAYPYSQYQKKLGELEPRFQASVFQSGTEWSRGSGTVYHFYETNTLQLKDIRGVGFMRKFVKGVTQNSPAPRWITFRLAEFYLNYAEALNEINGSPTEIEWAVNQVRRRVDMPDVRYTNQEDMRKIIRRERAVEFAFEQHRYFDLRRWKTASEEGVMKGRIYTLKLYDTKPEPTYKLEQISSRVWDDKMYLYPFRQQEVDLGYITQNPGW